MWISLKKDAAIYDSPRQLIAAKEENGEVQKLFGWHKSPPAGMMPPGSHRSSRLGENPRAV